MTEVMKTKSRKPKRNSIRKDFTETPADKGVDYSHTMLRAWQQPDDVGTTAMLVSRQGSRLRKTNCSRSWIW